MLMRLLFAIAMLLPGLAGAQSVTPAAATTPDAVPAPTVAPAPEPAPVINPRVMLVTTAGDIVLELDAEHAPKTVENFLSYVDDGHYNGTIFHRAIPGMLIQGGGFTLDLQHKPTRAAIASESNNGLPNLRGTLAAARAPDNADSATAQFFINTVDNPDLDYRSDESDYTRGYTVFGRVLQGLDVVDRIASVKTGAQGPFNADVPETPIIISRVERIEASATTP